MFWLRLLLGLLVFVGVRYGGNYLTDDKHQKTWFIIAVIAGLCAFFSDLAVRLAD